MTNHLNNYRVPRENKLSERKIMWMRRSKDILMLKYNATSMEGKTQYYPLQSYSKQEMIKGKQALFLRLLPKYFKDKLCLPQMAISPILQLVLIFYIDLSKLNFR